MICLSKRLEQKFEEARLRSSVLMILRLLAVLPQARRWVDQLVEFHWPAARPVQSFGFARLPEYYSEALLASVRVAVVDEVPAPPLERWGVGAFKDLGAPIGRNAAGMTLRNLFFVKRGRETSESLFFHELIHVIQWNRLGVNAFLALYGLLLRRHGYENSPLESMAYDLQARFNQKPHQTFAAESIVARRVDELAASFARQSLTNRAALSFLRFTR